MKARWTFKGLLRVTVLPLFVLQFPIDALLGRCTLFFNSWSWLRAVKYQLTDQPWYAFYAEEFLLGQRTLGEPALWLGAGMLVLQPLLWAMVIAAGLLALTARRSR